jgi:hypothetical protein
MIGEAMTKTAEAEQPRPSDDSWPEAALSRRAFVQALGAGLLITVTGSVAAGVAAEARRPWPPGCTSTRTARSP